MRMFLESTKAVLLLIIIGASIGGTDAWAQAAVRAQHVELWGIQEITLHSGHAYDNPFRDVQLQARFTSNGHSVLVPGFYDGDHTWRIRFMPEQQGAWQFTTIANGPRAKQSAGRFHRRPTVA
jgi:hypothetical protein